MIAAPIVTAWPRPLDAWVVEGGEAVEVRLLTAVFHLDTEEGFYVGCYAGGVATLHRWPSVDVVLEEGALLRITALRASERRRVRAMNDQQCDDAIAFVRSL